MGLILHGRQSGCLVCAVCLEPLCGSGHLKGTGEMVALESVTSNLQSGLGVGCGFNAFGHHFEVEYGGEVTDGFDDGDGMRIGHGVDEAAVDLDGVQGQAAQHVE